MNNKKDRNQAKKDKSLKDSRPNSELEDELQGDTTEIVDEIKEDLERAQCEAADYLDNLKRLKAEFDNFRKRMLKEQSEFLKLAAQQVIGELLPVIDNFERALAHEIHGDQIEEYKGGMQMVYKQLKESLSKEGLKALEPVGEPFDPTRHEAMMTMESDEYPEGTVIKVIEKGYLLKDRVIRPAKVAVVE